jgi:hypothetical protein
MCGARSGPHRFQKTSSVCSNFKAIFEEIIDRFEHQELALWAMIATSIFMV